MVGKVTFEIKGGKEIDAFLKDFGPKVASRLGDKALRAAAKPIIQEARRLVPKDTGELRKSIVARSNNKRRGANQRAYVIGFKTPTSARAHFIEYGTSKMSAQPFIRPAMDGQTNQALKAMVDAFAVGIEREEWKRATALGGDIVEIT